MDNVTISVGQFEVKVVADSIWDGHRLTTLSLLYPRFIHQELMTHRAFSRNAASSRAIPIQKIIDQVSLSPAMPIYWGKNQKGMQAASEIDAEAKRLAANTWLMARNSAIQHAAELMNLGVHKQTVNRILEPFMLMNTIVTATDWDNFFNLRLHESAQPEIRQLAEVMLDALNLSVPRKLNEFDWHLPYVTDEEVAQFGVATCAEFSVARCARVSYKTHEGVVDQVKDRERFKDLLESGHMSPMEHQAQATMPTKSSEKSNLKSWLQFRKILRNPYESSCIRLISK